MVDAALERQRTLLLTAVALPACFVPALRATKVDPLVAFVTTETSN